MTPLYFFPGLTAASLTRAQLQELPAAESLRDCLVSETAFRELILKADCKYGPSGSSGALVAASPGETPPEIMYKPDRQRWVQFGDYWIGVFKDNLPTPAELERRDQLPGYLEELGDGLQWNCPLIRTPYADTPQMRIPRKFGVDDQGNLVNEPLPEYCEAWERTAEIWNWIAFNEQIDIDVCITYAAQLLGLNYRVSRNECLLLNLFDETNLKRVFIAACDKDFFELCLEEQKKNT